VYYQRSVEAIQNANPQITNVNQLNFREPLIIPGLTETIVLTRPVVPRKNDRGDRFGFPGKPESISGLVCNPAIFKFRIRSSQERKAVFEQRLFCRIRVSWSTVDRFRYTIQCRNAWFRRGLRRVHRYATKANLRATGIDLAIEWSTWYEAAYRGSSLPQFSQIQYTFGPQDAAPFLTGTTWTEINGTFASEVIIPTSANFGENWQVIVSGVDDPTIQASSALFTVQQSIHPE
jgi:hypothetical protein